MTTETVPDLTRYTVPTQVVASVKAVGWQGFPLPRTRVSGSFLYPVVEIDEEAWRQREESGVEPMLDRFTLSQWKLLDVPEHPSPPSPLRITGFVATTRLREALGTLNRLFGYAPGMVVVESAREPNGLALMEVDLCDMSLAWAKPNGEANILWRGRQTRIATAAQYPTVADRRKEEALYAWARITRAREEALSQSSTA